MCTACTDNLHEPQQIMLLITFYKRFENFRLFNIHINCYYQMMG